MKRTELACCVVPWLTASALLWGLLPAVAAPEGKSPPPSANTVNEPAAAKPKADVPPTLTIYQLKHADPEQVSSVLRTMLTGTDVRLSVDPKTSAMIVAGSPETHTKVAGLLEKLDVPPQRGYLPQIKIFSLKNMDPASAAKVLAELGVTDIRIATDERTRSVLAAGPPESLTVAEALFLRLDEEARPARAERYEVRVAWLVDGMEGGSGQPPAEDLKDVVAELARVGIKNPRQVGHMIVQTTIGDNCGGMFEVKSSPHFGDQRAGFSASGMLSRLPEGTLAMQIQISTKRESSPQHENLNEVNTQIVLPEKQYVVLATAPVGNQTSVFVVQVTSGTKPAEKKQEKKQ